MRAHPGQEVKYVDLRIVATVEERFATVSSESAPTASATVGENATMTLTTTTSVLGTETTNLTRPQTVIPQSVSVASDPSIVTSTASASIVTIPAQLAALATVQNRASLVSLDHSQVVSPRISGAALLADSLTPIPPSLTLNGMHHHHQSASSSSNFVVDVSKNPSVAQTFLAHLTTPRVHASMDGVELSTPSAAQFLLGTGVGVVGETTHDTSGTLIDAVTGNMS